MNLSIDSLMEFLQKLLGQLGVSESARPLWALVTLYLAVTLLVLMLVAIIWWSNRRKQRRRAGAVPLSGEVEAATGEAPPTGGYESDSSAPPVEAVPALVKPTPVGIGVATEVAGTVRSGLQKTRNSLLGRLGSLFKGGAVFSPELLEELEEVLMTSDFGVQTTVSLVADLQERFAGQPAPADEVYRALQQEISSRLNAVPSPTVAPVDGPEVIMVVGVNGVGKTTTIGKLASRYRAEGKSVLLAAGDTFRAAAAEQLATWAERAGAEIVRHGEGGDPAAVTFDAAKAAVARKSEILIVDTAGRLHTKTNLMEELKKVRRVLDREISGAPHRTLLVVDATTGQNALTQAKMFQEAVQVDGIVLTKLDGSAKGGIIVAICTELNIPVCYVGVGEGVNDLRPFNPEDYVAALFDANEVT